MLFQSPAGASESAKRSFRPRQSAGLVDSPSVAGREADTARGGVAVVPPEARGAAADTGARTAVETAHVRTEARRFQGCSSRLSYSKLEKVALDGSVECCAPPPRWCDLEL